MPNKRKGKITPSQNEEGEKTKIPLKEKPPSFYQVTKAAIGTQNILDSVTSAKKAASRWRGYVTKKRSITRRSKDATSNQNSIEKPKGGSGLGDISEAYTLYKSKSARNSFTLLQYFSKLGSSEDGEEELDLDFVQELIENGADLNCTDKYGQTIFHEVARTWHVDVGKFLLEQNANLNTPDKYGRTPLHVAAAVDYADMCQFLIDRGADKEARTTTERQTPVHFAARNDAAISLACLIKNKCEYKEVKDYRGRTPIYVAAELDRSESARYLLEQHAPVGIVDDSGQPALTWMINKMAPVAKIALDQLHSCDRANRKQYFYLNHMEPLKPGEQRQGLAQMPLETVVHCKNIELVVHPVVKELISIKWKKFGKFGAFRNLIFNLIFIILWTTIALHSEWYDKCYYDFTGGKDVWKVVLYVVAVITTVYQIVDEMRDFVTSHRQHKRWKEWREAQIDRDIEQCHPRWPEEKQFLENEKLALDDIKPQYFNDFWNVFDWINYATLLASTITHLIDVAWPGHIAILHNQIMSVNIILVWLRLMKFVRAFTLLGPFIVMLGQMAADCGRFMFLYIEFFIPFACAFWMIFGGRKPDLEELIHKYNGTCVAANLLSSAGARQHVADVENMEDIDSLLFSLFRLTLVDEYDLAGMLRVDKAMTYILVSGWLAISAILFLNIFIALLSDTFVRVYDNARANAVMQKAITVLNMEDDLWERTKLQYRKYIHEQCSPEVLYYDDDVGDGGDELHKATYHNSNKLDDIIEMWHLKFGVPSVNHEGDRYYPDSEEEDTDDEGTVPLPPPSESTPSHAMDASPLDGGKKLKRSGTMNRKRVTTNKLESEVDILRAELVTVEKKRRNFERKCMSELQELKSLLMSQAQGRLMPIPVHTDVPALDQAAFQRFQRPVQQHSPTIDVSETPPPAYPAMMGERITPRGDTSVSHVDITTVSGLTSDISALPPVRIRSDLDVSRRHDQEEEDV